MNGLKDIQRAPLTLVFLINVFKAPTPPLSPADIPSTSSIIKQVLESIFNPAAFISCKFVNGILFSELH